MLPSLFISHGAPTVMVEHESPGHQFLKELAAHFEKPKAIVVVSAHWETEKLLVTGASKPETIHDFYGFDDALYQLNYPAPGAPELAEEIATLTGAEIDLERGIDHGVWSPLILAYPDAEIPVVQLSLPINEEPEFHYELGQKLSPLREKGILLIGSGSLTHNLRELKRGDDNTDEWALSFEDWFVEAIKEDQKEALLDAKNQAPFYDKNHPTDEHWLPFYFVMGAAGKGELLYRGFERKNLSMAAVRFD